MPRRNRVADRSTFVDGQLGTIADLTPDPNNPRTHGPRNIGIIVDAIQRVGMGRSIVVDEGGNLLAGHGTLEAAAEAGISKVRYVVNPGDEIVAVVRNNLTEEQKIELGLRDNRASDMAGYDPNVLLGLATQPGIQAIVDELFTDEEIAGIMAMADELDAEQETEEPVSPDVQGMMNLIGRPSYTIRFDNTRQQIRWNAFLALLTERQPDKETIGARLYDFLGQVLGQAAQETTDD